MSVFNGKNVNKGETREIAPFRKREGKKRLRHVTSEVFTSLFFTSSS